MQQHAEIHHAVLQETAKLHSGDRENLQLWKEFLPKCREDIQQIYDRLDVKFDVELGESFYHDQLAAVVEDLLARGLAQESEGAICVFLDGFDAPMIIRKQDGAFLYATTDLATIKYRMQKWSPDAILYVVDFRQSRTLREAVSRSHGGGAIRTSNCGTSSLARCWAKTASRFAREPAIPSAWKVCWTPPCNAPSRSSATTTTPSPTGRS